MKPFAKIHALLLATVSLGFSALHATATTYYVDINSPGPTPPYSSWSTASTDIQSAVNLTTNGDLVLVANGTYTSAGYPAPDGFGYLTCVVVTNAIVLQSANGPAGASINGGSSRCIYLANGATLSGFTLMNGAGAYYGGIYAPATNVVITNCVITRCSSNSIDGAINSGTLFNCLITSNNLNGSGLYGANQSVMFNCTLVHNWAVNCVLNNCLLTNNSGALGGVLNNCFITGSHSTYGGAISASPGYPTVLNSCILSNNFAEWGGGAYNGSPNYNSCILNSCLIISNTSTSSGGGAYQVQLNDCTVIGNNAGDAGLSGGLYDCLGRNCIIYYNNGGTYGSALTNCDTFPLPPGLANFTNAPAFANSAAGNFQLSPSSPCINAGNNAYVTTATDLAGNPRIIWGTVDLGAYESPYNTTNFHYVSLASTNPVPPYNDWSIAATNIQTAINASLNGDQIIVTDGVYQSSGYMAPVGTLLSSVVITNAITLQSVNGPEQTSIDGSNIIRCAYLANGATLIGFTLTNGFTQGAGGGALCASNNVLLSNCVLINNCAENTGGGIYSGTLNNCVLLENVAFFYGGGANGSTLNNCIITGNLATNNANNFNDDINGGGGVADSTLSNCFINNNRSSWGAGAYFSTLNSCIISNNLAMPSYASGGAFVDQMGMGGGAIGSTLQNCLIISNSAPYVQFSSSYGGGTCSSHLTNCVIQGNSAYEGGGAVGDNEFNLNGCMDNCLLIGNLAYGSGGGYVGNFSSRTTLTNCVISGNSAPNYGGAVDAGLFNCLVIGNTATTTVGGVGECTSYNCTICLNSATVQIGGMYGGAAYNSTIYYNTSPISPNIGGPFFAANCCFGQDVTNGTGFFTNAPLFVNLASGDFHLQSNSPCINAGNNTYVNTATDLDGNPRIVGGTVDIGAYEYQSPVSMVSYQWLQQYALPITNNIDASSPNGTAFDVYQDWIAGLNPTNAASVLVMLSPPATNNSSGITVSWQSVSGILYNLQRSTNLTAPTPFTTIAANLPGQAGTTRYTDTTATNNVPYYYRVGVP